MPSITNLAAATFCSALLGVQVALAVMLTEALIEVVSPRDAVNFSLFRPSHANRRDHPVTVRRLATGAGR